MSNPFAAIRERVPLRTVIERYGLRLDRHEKALCPFHAEKTPSFCIKDNRWHCFGCGETGDVVDFVARMENINAIEAARKLDEDFHLGLFREPTPTERRQARAAATQQRRDKQLVQSFDTWWHNAWHTMLWWQRYIKSEIERLHPQSLKETDPELFAFALRELDKVNHMLATMNTDNLEEKVAVYTMWKEEIECYECNRKGGVSARTA